MWEWLAANTNPVPRGSMLVGILILLALGAILGFAITAWASLRP